MNYIFITVIIPVYKTDFQLIDRCIQSVLRQTYQHYECLVVDDGNTDEYATKLDKIAELDNRIKVLHKENGGLGNTRNFAAERAIGEYLFFLDSDDYISPYTLENGIDIIVKYHPDMVVGGLQHLRPDEEPAFSEKPKKEIVIKGKEDMVEYINHISNIKSEKYKLTIGSTGTSACSKLIRKELVREVPFENDKYWDEDNLWNISAVAQSKILVILDTVWYAYVINPDSMVRGYAGSRIKEFQFRAKQEYERIKKMWPECIQAAYFIIWDGLLRFCRTDIFQVNNPKNRKEKYKDFCEGIDFPEFIESMQNINFNTEKRFKHRVVKKIIQWAYVSQHKKLLYYILLVCIRKIKF